MTTIFPIKIHPQAFYIIPDTTISVVTEVVKVDYLKVDRLLADERIDERHLRHFYVMGILFDGEVTLEIENDGKHFLERKRGQAWIVPPFWWYQISSTKPFWYVAFQFHVNPRFWNIIGNKPDSFYVPEHLCQSIIRVCESSVSNGKFVDQCMSALATLCLSEYVQQCSSKCPQMITVPHDLEGIRQELWPLLEKMQMGQGKLWTVEEMAKEMGLSRDYFSRCFRQIVGQSPHLYILETTMRTAAASLMQVPGDPIKKIAEDAGYSTVQSFSSAFKKVFKISPAAYRIQALRHEDN